MFLIFYIFSIYIYNTSFFKKISLWPRQCSCFLHFFSNFIFFSFLKSFSCSYPVNVIYLFFYCSMIYLQLFAISRDVFASLNNFTIPYFSFELLSFLQPIIIFTYLKFKQILQNKICYNVTNFMHDTWPLKVFCMDKCLCAAVWPVSKIIYIHTLLFSSQELEIDNVKFLQMSSAGWYMFTWFPAVCSLLVLCYSCNRCMKWKFILSLP